MAVSPKYPARSAERDVFEGTITFATNGSSDPAAATLDDLGAGIAASVVHSATGRYLITLDDTYKRVRATAQLHDTSAAIAVVSAYSASPSNTIQVSTLNASLAEADTTGKTVVVNYRIQR